MPDPNVTALNARLLDLINTGVDSNTGVLNNLSQQNPGGTGREYVNNLYPTEFEYYAAALELVDGDDNTEEFFSFPVMFKNYRENIINNTSIEKTMAGVVVTTNPTFVPFDIHMTGNFGRKFKKIDTSNIASSAFGGKEKTANGGSFDPVSGVPVFSTEYKTGYGCYKIMERIIKKASKQDTQYKPYKLFFYNLALDSNYLVEPIILEPNQNRENSNMIWEYNLHLKAIAPASAVNKNFKTTSLKLLTDYGNLTKEAAFSSDEIERYKQDRLLIDKQQSPLEKIISNQLRGRAFGLFNNSQKSAIMAMMELVAKPSYLDVFSLNVGEGILNRFPSPTNVFSKPVNIF